MAFKKKPGELAFDTFNTLFLFVLSLCFIYPLLHVLFASFSNPNELIKHTGILFGPLGFSTKGYQLVLSNPNILMGYGNTFFYVIIGTTTNLLFTCLGAYVLSRKTLYIKKALMVMIIFTMYFHGGLIPRFLTVKMLGMYDSRLALILPTAIATWNLIILRTAFMAIPDSLEESAKIDGANDFVILFRILIPVAKAALAVQILFYAVGHWNGWFDAMIFLKDRAKYPLQLFLREILISADVNSMNPEALMSEEVDDFMATMLIKYCTIIVATVPILFIYPFLQKHFAKGVMVGSLKG